MFVNFIELLYILTICFLHLILRLPASEVAKSTIQEGPQYSIYQKRDEI